MSKTIRTSLAQICVVCLILTLIAGVMIPAGAIEGEAEYTEIPLYIDGIRAGSGFKMDSTTYIPIRAFCEALEVDAEISWDEESKTAAVTMAGLTFEATEGQSYMTANGRYLFFENGTRNINGVLLLPIATLATIFGTEVEWDDEHWTMNIDLADIDYIQGGETYYDDTYEEQDLYWLARIINAESGNQSLEGMIGVGNVVLNRVADETCPNTIFDVIFDTKYGVQFNPVTTGTIYDEPNELSVIAAKLCLEGYNTVENSLYFVNPEIGATSWFYNTRTFVASIGDHDFYA